MTKLSLAFLRTRTWWHFVGFVSAFYIAWLHIVSVVVVVGNKYNLRELLNDRRANAQLPIEVPPAMTKLIELYALPAEQRMVTVKRSDTHSKYIQYWMHVDTHNDANTLYVYFKGTQNLHDIQKDLNARPMAVRYNGYRVRVHRGMARAMAGTILHGHSFRKHGVMRHKKGIVDHLHDMLFDKGIDIEYIRIGGHSLGGGYAQLLFMALSDPRCGLWKKVHGSGVKRRKKQEIMKKLGENGIVIRDRFLVLTFGAPLIVYHSDYHAGGDYRLRVFNFQFPNDPFTLMFNGVRGSRDKRFSTNVFKKPGGFFKKLAGALLYGCRLSAGIATNGPWGNYWAAFDRKADSVYKKDGLKEIRNYIEYTRSRGRSRRRGRRRRRRRRHRRDYVTQHIVHGFKLVSRYKKSVLQSFQLCTEMIDKMDVHNSVHYFTFLLPRMQAFEAQKRKLPLRASAFRNERPGMFAQLMRLNAAEREHYFAYAKQKHWYSEAQLSGYRLRAGHSHQKEEEEEEEEEDAVEDEAAVLGELQSQLQANTETQSQLESQLHSKPIHVPKKKKKIIKKIETRYTKTKKKLRKKLRKKRKKREGFGD